MSKSLYGNIAKSLTFGSLTLLLIEFILGMWINLFVSLPPGTPNRPPYQETGFMMGPFFGGSFGGAVMAHFMLGLLIALVSFVIMILAFLLGDLKVMMTGVISFLFIVVAGISGLSFMMSGFTNNFYSFLMSVGFILAFSSYSALLYFLKT
ncbi:MAG: hypothetical protein QXH43_09275 [Metallosphaera sp.]|uniref:hypothetical protein n=2 Tax=Metallosphaera sp. TaxID=2020860 RepID=UPI00316D339B